MRALPIDTDKVAEICRQNDEAALSPYLRERIMGELQVIYAA